MSSHCVKSVRIRSFSGPYFPAFKVNTERYEVSHRIQSQCVKIRTRKTQITYTFHAVSIFKDIMLHAQRLHNFDFFLLNCHALLEVLGHVFFGLKARPCVIFFKKMKIFFVLKLY